MIIKNDDLNKDEKKVLTLLRENPRQSPNKIAEKCNFSRQKAWRILKKLEKQGSIWGYAAIVDNDSIGQNIYFALAKVKPNFYKYIEKTLYDIKNNTSEKLDGFLLGSYFVNGKYDWITIFYAENIRSAKKFYAFMQKTYGEYLEKNELVETVFPLVKFGKVNPNLEEINEFAIP